MRLISKSDENILTSLVSEGKEATVDAVLTLFHGTERVAEVLIGVSV